MNRRKWLLGEIEDWESRELISQETADTLRGLYGSKSGAGLLLIIFSIIGSALIGAGIILISAKNWYDLPVWFRVVIAFTPLVAAQLLCGFVVLKKMDSVAWREGSAIFLTLSVFTAVALVGQIFHIPGDFGKYILTCGLLSLPVIYILNAASPTVIYLWTALNWAILLNIYNSNEYIRFWLLGLLALIAPFMFVNIKNDRFGAKGQLLLWLCTVSGFIANWTVSAEFGYLNPNHLICMIFLYCIMIYLADAVYFKNVTYNLRPLKLIGGLGILVLLFIYSYSGIWEYHKYFYFSWGSDFPYIALALLLFGAVIFWLMKARESRMEMLIASLALITAIAAAILSNFKIDTILPSAIVNLFILAIGISIILRGIKEMQVGYTNLGMFIVCLLIILRFFDWELEFLTKGIAFVVLGIGFLSANIYISKKRKAAIEK